MPTNRSKKIWADPNREGQGKGKQAERFCSKCGNTVQQARILKSLNLCEFCVRELEAARDGINSCRGCGKIAPIEVKEHHGYCIQCICGACGKPDPFYVRKTGLCFQCASALGDFCRKCGKEAAAQVRKNRGYCDECAGKTGARHEIKDGKASVRYKGLRDRNKTQETKGKSAYGKKQVIKSSSTSFNNQDGFKLKRNKPVVESKKPRRIKPATAKVTRKPL